MSRSSREDHVWTMQAWDGDTVEVRIVGVDLILTITDRAGNQAAARLSPDEGDDVAPPLPSTVRRDTGSASEAVNAATENRTPITALKGLRPDH
jgi:hypothetical protein